jgi:citrate lyase subunit beta/citryl-CoA lyase
MRKSFYFRRTMMMTPGNRPDRILKATNLACDALVIDLEDSIPPNQKQAARRCVVDVLKELPANNQELCVRINGLDTNYWRDDLQDLPLKMIDSLMIPKIESAKALIELEDHLVRLGVDQEQEYPLQLIVMIETQRGILNAISIADALARTSALFFGSGDYTSETGAKVNANALHYPRSVVTAAAGARKIQAVDAAFFENVRDARATREDALIAREFGFCGKVVFHPNQIEAVNEVFSPSPEELARAAKIVAAYQESAARGLGTVLVDDVFVAIDLVAPAQRLLDLAEQLSKKK